MRRGLAKGGKMRRVWLDRKVRYFGISIAFHGGSLWETQGLVFQARGVYKESESQCLPESNLRDQALREHGMEEYDAIGLRVKEGGRRKGPGSYHYIQSKQTLI